MSPESVAAIADAALGRARSTTRYAMWCAALGAMLLLPLGTFLLLRVSPAAVTSSSAAIARAAQAPAVVDAAAMPVPVERPWPSWLVGAWLAGVALFGVRALTGWFLVQRLRVRLTSPVAITVEDAVRRLCAILGVRGSVRVLATSAAKVPVTFGWLRPVVLLPVSAFTALTPEQLELLIAHELAHVRRHDYVVNLVQTCLETALFHHPAVWWVSGRIRAERENCCDDLVVASCGDATQYVRALAALEGLRSFGPALVLGADGGPLLSRIKRLHKGRRPNRKAPPVWIGALLPLAAVVALVLSGGPRPASAASSHEPRENASGFLSGLADAGYKHLTVDEIIALKEHGIDPRYIKEMAAAGLGTPGVNELNRLHDHGVEPGFVAAMVSSALVSELGFETVIHLSENAADGDDMARIRALGFGPFAVDDVIRLRQHGVEAPTFQALKEAGRGGATVADAVMFQENGVTTERIQKMKSQGFGDLSLEQIVKLCQAGII